MQVNNFLSDPLVKDPGLNLPEVGGWATPKPSSNSANANPSVVVNLSASALERSGPLGIAATPSLTVAKFLAMRSTLTTANIVDSASNIAKNLDALNASASLSKIGTVSQLGVPSNLVVTHAQWLNDRATLAISPPATSILTKMSFDTTGVANRIIVNGVPDAGRSVVTDADDRTLVGVTGVAIENIDARIADFRVSNIGVSDVLNSDLTLYASKFANAKVTSLNVINISSSDLNAVLKNPKVKGVTVTGVLARDVSSVAGNPRVASLSIADTPANLAKNFAIILSKNSKVTSVSQTGSAADLTITAGQFSAATSLMAKFTAPYTVRLTGVQARDVASLSANSSVNQISIADNVVNISENLGALNTNLTKVNNIAIAGGAKSPLSLSADQYLGSALGAFTTGTAAGWSSGVAVGAAVTFTSSVANTAVDDLTSALDISVSAPSIAINTGSASRTETAAVTFKPMAAGQTLSMAGLTFTAGLSGATAAQVASAFASITAGTAAADINTTKTLNAAAGGTFTSGTSANWTSGTASSAVVTFTSTTANADVDNLSGVFNASASAVTLVTTQGVNASTTESTVITFKALAAGQKLSIAGLTFTAGPSGATADQVASAFASIAVGRGAESLNIAKSFTASSTQLLEKVAAGAYRLNITNANSASLGQLLSNSAVSSVNLVGVTVADLAGGALNSPKVKSMQVADTAANITNGLTTIKSNIAKISQVTNSGVFMSEVSFTSETYDAKLVDKLSGFSIAVSYALTPSTRYSIKTNAQGIRTVTDNTNSSKAVYSNNVNFFKFSDKNLFGTTGNKNVDAVLLSGTDDWWYDPALSPKPGAQKGTTQITSSMNALDATSSKHALTFSFLNLATITGVSNSSKDLADFAEMSDTQKNAVKAALDYISTITNLTFSLAPAGTGDINFGTNNQGASSAGYAYSPNSAPHINLMLNNQSSTNANFAQGTYGWETLVHEIAHAIGLKHPGNYNAGGGGTEGPYLPAGDGGSRRYSIMSYNNPADGQNVTATPVDEGTSYSLAALNPTTLMTYDIAALQFLYGVNTTSTAVGAAGTADDQNLGAGGMTTETAAVTFKPMAAGQTLSMAGLTFTAGLSGATAAQVASAFASITAGTAAADINTTKTLNAAAGGTFTSGTSANWTSGTASSAVVTFTSTTANAEVTNLSATLSQAVSSSAPTVTTTDGVAATSTESAAVVFKAMLPGQLLTMAGLTFTAGTSGATAAQVAAAFGSIAVAGSRAATINTAKSLSNSTGGTFTAGSSTGWVTGVAAGTGVTFTSTTANTNVSNLIAYSGVLQTPDIVTTGGAKSASDYQRTSFNSAWRGFEALYIPEAVTGEVLDLSGVSNSNIVDLRGGAFSSINILPPETKTTLPNATLQRAQTYFGLNNVALAYGTRINDVAGGAGSDAYYVSDYNVRIADLSAGNTVYLTGSAAEWSTSSPATGTTVYTNSLTSQTVTLTGGEFRVLYYNAAVASITHSLVDLTA